MPLSCARCGTPLTHCLLTCRPLGSLRVQNNGTQSAKELLRSKALDQTSKPMSVSLSEKHFSLPTKFTDLDPTG